MSSTCGAAYYADSSYSNWQRITSYFLQVQLQRHLQVRSVLEIGTGDGFVTQALRQMGVETKTLDLNPDLNPDIPGSVEAIPVPDGSFDAVNCCQVLEHLPFDRFRPSLEEVRRVAKRYLVLSLPDTRFFCELGLKIPGVQHLAMQCSVPRYINREVPNSCKQCGHHWEIGYAGTSFTQVKRAILDAGWHCTRVLRNTHNPWHCFFVCAKR